MVFTQSFWGTWLRNHRTAAGGLVPPQQWCWNHFCALSSVVWKREAEVKSKFANDSEPFWAVKCWANDVEIQEDLKKVEICPIVRNFPYKLLYLAILRPQSLAWSACLGLFTLAVEFLNSSKKHHKKDTYPFHFVKVSSSKLLLSVKKTTPLNLFQRKISGITRSCNSFCRTERSSPDSKGLTEEDTQHPSTVKQSVGGRQLSVSCRNTVRRKSPLLSWR